MRTFNSEYEAFLAFMEDQYGYLPAKIPEYMQQEFEVELRQSKNGVYYLDYDM